MQENIFGNAFKAITAPSDFYKTMQREGGYVEPAIFVLVMAFVAALFFGLVDLWAVGFRHALASLMQNIIIFPVVGMLCVTAASVLFYFFWKFLGSTKDFETAFRCTAYVTAIAPLYVIAEHIHFIFVVISVFWAAYILSVASDEVQNVSKKYAMIAFVLLALIVLWRICCDSSADIDEDDLQPAPSDLILKEAVSELLGENKQRVEKNIFSTDTPVLIHDSAIDHSKSELDLNTKAAELSILPEPGNIDLGEAPVVKQVESHKSPVEATGEALGNLVKEAGEAVTHLSEELVDVFDKNEVGDESKSLQDVPKSQAVSEDHTLAKKSANVMTPEQLGEAVGSFIQKLQAAAENANKGFEAGVNGAELSAPNGMASEKAGQALGEFIKGFNAAMEGLEIEETNENTN